LRFQDALENPLSATGADRTTLRIDLPERGMHVDLTAGEPSHPVFGRFAVTGPWTSGGPTPCSGWSGIAVRWCSRTSAVTRQVHEALDGS
jgi:hypothetical protein